jgi:hypothetical protein
MYRVGVLLVGALLLAGCAPTPVAPPGIAASVVETRFDAALGQVQLRVTNGSDHPLTIVSAALVSDRYPDSTPFDRGQTVPPGSARDLPVLLGPARCGPEATASDDAARVIVTLEDGRTAQSRLPLGDDAILAAANERDCRIESVRAHADIVPPDALVWTPGAARAATLTFSVVPTGAAGTLTILSANPTALLGLVDASGERVTPRALNLVIDAQSAPMTFDLGIVPARCDAHAIAEDKQGTLMPFDISTSDGADGQVRIAVPDAVRTEIYDYVTDYCATVGG